MKSSSTKLAEAVANLACDAVRIQRLLDEAGDRAELDFARTLASLPEEGRSFFLPLAPVRRAITEHRVRCSIQVGTSLKASAEVRIAPIKLGLSAAYAERRQAISSLEVLVVRAPLSEVKV